MANLMANLDLAFGTGNQTSCGQIEAERNHDFKAFNAPNKHNVLNALQGQACGAFALPPPAGQDEGHPRWTDESFVRYIFNTDNATTSKAEVQQRGLGNIAPANTIQYRGQIGYGGTGPGGQALFNGSIHTFDNDITGILHHLTAIYGPNTNLYLFVDTGHKLLTKFANVLSSTPNTAVHLNIINSQANFGDPCQGGKDLCNAKLFAAATKLHCWWHWPNLTVPAFGAFRNFTGQTANTPALPPYNNYMFHTNLTCELSDTVNVFPFNKVITQTWSPIKNKSRTIHDSATNNSIGQQKKDYDLAGNTDYQTKAFCWTRKRSGDGFQLWFINRFVDVISIPDGHLYFKCTYSNGVQNPPAATVNPRLQQQPAPALLPQPPQPPPQSYYKAIIRSRSFFVTIDWPAFCWAAFCHINVLFVLGSKVFVFIANHNHLPPYCR